jgi:hypothetical protein
MAHLVLDMRLDSDDHLWSVGAQRL